MLQTTFVDDLKAQNLEVLEGMLEVCPKVKKPLILVDALIRKQAWGGKKSDPSNIFRMSQAADFDYYFFAKEHPRFREACEANVKEGNEIFALILKEFLLAPTPVLSGEAKVVKILGLLCRSRIQQMLDRQRDNARYSRVTKELDEFYPMKDARVFKKAHDLFPEEKDYSWQNFFMGISADTKLKMQLIEKEIAEVLMHHPVWTEFLAKVPGIGPWFAGYLISVLKDPRGFAKTSNISGLCGTRVAPDGFAQKAKSPFWKQLNLSPEAIEALKAKLKEKDRSPDALDYDPFLKMLIVEVLPVTMTKIHGMMKKKGTTDESPYVALLDSIWAKERMKAIKAHPTECRICKSMGIVETDIVNLGMKKREDELDEATGAVTKVGGEYFAGYCCKKTLGKAKEHKFFDPKHVQRRVQREFGKKVFADIYHAWLYFLGENPDLGGNQRIMHFLKMDEK